MEMVVATAHVEQCVNMIILGLYTESIKIHFYKPSRNYSLNHITASKHFWKFIGMSLRYLNIMCQ